MFLKRIGLIGLVLGVGMGAAACTDGYGYSGVAVGYNSGGYYGDPYYGDGYGYADPYYGGGYGLGGASYYGWYNNFYYPGTGIYVYDQNRRRYRWNDNQRHYWEGRRGNYANRDVRDNWQGFRRDVRNERRDYRGDLRDNRQAYRNGTVTQEQFRAGRRDARQEYRRDVRQDYRQLRRENRAEGVRTPRPDRALTPRPNRGGRTGANRNERPR